ncbi:unnamed protein product [Camellia sinensis]|uniref:mitogen-activated protein kinase kinase kinase 18 n=1 Tax=Camellia sinensis TaxID=4442 RepID=UPI00103670CC|nr:mitogen-activated protein kinase kinase kinase 18 [Camellia sinensis]
MNWTRGHTIGRGSSATVSAATSPHSGNVFAVKSTELSQSQFLQREQKILSTLVSPHVVEYIGYDITKEKDKLVYNLHMEYVPGGTLSDAIRRHGGGGGGRLDEAVIGNYTREILKGLEYIHSIGVAHCDVKSQNILVGESGAKLADFGCAKWLNPREDKAAPIGGTPMFMAPEVARGEEQGLSGDIWALGCTVIEMATGGRSPWTRVADPVSVLYRIGFSGEIPEFPDFLSSQAKDFLGKCLKRDPKERWTAKQLLNHTFLGESNSHTKQFVGFNSDSPTSILDHGVWNTVEESETLDSDSPAKRIGGLLLCSGVANWRWDENWITIRSNNNEH